MATSREIVTVTFDVRSSDNYTDKIASLRNQVGNPKHFSHNRPVLPPEQEEVQVAKTWSWFHVVLKTATNELTLKSRRDNLYLVGFQSKKDNRWWEFTDDKVPTRRLIAGSTLLGFGGSYRDLLGDPDKRMTELNLGPQQMTKAVNVLAAFTEANLSSAAGQKEVKDSLATLLFMVHEATRFTAVSSFLAGMMHPRAEKKSGTITSQMKEQINGWKDLSKALLFADERPTAQFPPFPGMGVATVEQAADAVGILKFVELKVKENGQEKTIGMTAATAMRLFLESQGESV